MRVPLVLGLLLVSVSGCASPAEEVTDEPVASASSSSTGDVAPVAALPVAETVALAFDGNLGTSGHGCVFPAGACQSVDATTDSSDLFLERPGANLTGLSFDVVWTSTSPATATLTVSAMVMATCDGCNSTMFDEVTGQSPLHVQVDGVSVPLTADNQLHIFVYNPQGLVYNPAVPAYGYVSVDQAFHVEGTATLSVPPA